MLNNTGCSRELWAMPLENSLLVATHLMATLCVVYPTNPSLPHLPKWIPQLWDTTTKALFKSRQMTSSAPSSSTEPIISSQNSVRLVKYNLPLLNLCWLLPVTFLPLTHLEMSSKRICDHPGNPSWSSWKSRWHWPPVALQYFFLPFMTMGMTFAFFHSLGTFHSQHELSERIVWSSNYKICFWR